MRSPTAAEIYSHNNHKVAVVDSNAKRSLGYLSHQLVMKEPNNDITTAYKSNHDHTSFKSSGASDIDY